MCGRLADVPARVALNSPFVQQLQFDATGRHHPPEAAVVAVDGQHEALVIFWRMVETTHSVWGCNLTETQP